MERLNREKKIEHKDIRIKMGTTNNDNPKAIYIELGFFVSPKYESKDYSLDISCIRHAIKDSIIRVIRESKLFDQKYIYTFELSQKGLSIGKRSYTSMQLILKQTTCPPTPLMNLIKEAAFYVQDLCDDVKYTFEKGNFNVYKNKT